MRVHRRRGRARSGLLLAALALASATALGRDRSDLRFVRLTTEDGLSQGYVSALVQDRHGFIWLGTEDGLNRYDGYGFVHFKNDPHDATSLSHNFVHALLEDREGRLWVGTERGVNLWDPRTRTFERFQHDPSDPKSLSDDRVRALLEDESGVLWVGTHRGLNRLDPDGGSFTRFLHSEANPASLSDDRVSCLFEDRSGALWIGTEGGGLNRLDRSTGFFLRYRHDPTSPGSLSHDNVLAVLEDASERLWVGTYGGGINLLESGRERFRHLRRDPTDPGSLSDDRVAALFEDLDGTMWVGTEAGLNRWDPDTGRFTVYRHDPMDPRSLGDDLIRSIFRDRGGVFWVGTRVGGVHRANPESGLFAHYTSDPENAASLGHPIVTSFAERGESAIWVGTFGGGLYRLDRSNGIFTPRRHDPGDEDGLASNRVMSLHADGTGVLWVGTFDSGLNRILADGTVRHYPPRPELEGELGAPGVTAIYEDRGGRIWLGTYGGGLHRYDAERDRFARYVHDPESPSSLSSDRVLVILESRDGSLWVGTEGGGLNRCDPRTLDCRHFRHDPARRDSIASDVVLAIHEDARGRMWVGTQGGGLNRLELEENGDATFRAYSEADGLANAHVYGVLEDGDGRLWMSTNRGLSRFDPETETFKNYRVSHGLQSHEFNVGAYLEIGSGELLFGGVNGFNLFDPADAVDNTHVPPIALTRFMKLDRSVPVPPVPQGEAELRIDYDDHVVTFEVAALDYADPKSNRYAYRLEGFNDAWIDLHTARRITFTNLDAGRYVLRVRAANNDGVWNEEGLAVPIRVVPPPWRSWWAYQIYGLLALGMSYGVWRRFRARAERESTYRRRLEEEVAARTKELEERYEELALAHRKLAETSVADSLTGLRNRRYVFDNMERDVAAILRPYDPRNDTGTKKESLVYMMVDLDHYKKINDLYGHDVGDDMLVEVGRILEEASRDSDTLVRWGGDEFLVYGRVSKQEDAKILAGRIAEMVRRRDFGARLGRELRTSCSIGFACFPFLTEAPTAIVWEQVLTIADRALYLAKSRGRNGWVGFLGTAECDVGSVIEAVLQGPERMLEIGLRIETSLEGAAGDEAPAHREKQEV